MKIIKSDIANIEEDVVLSYKMTKGKGTTSVNKLTPEELALHYDVQAYVLYEDENNKGETVEILSILVNDGDVLAAQSATFKRSFFEIVDICKGRHFAIHIIDGNSKNGRRYMDCELAEVM